ncbi:cytochrome c oxidase assembly protein subunit 15 [Devosia enhydra]|uniref:Heme A synthase n=1 Tax=Devosia enhydra TaxID=665118 RepID=A0A1K2HUQ8_9HYPH|nr:COX15/CtaA family protein [Devosia enhydra]SFZ82225.1 cytochrome c oxidase assembly protein subunit 15 [Devosia enhydra]
MTSIAADTSLHHTLRADRLRPVRIWLWVMAGLVLLMVVVGGATRLTESGLSITSWRPLSGTIPPLSDADWQAEFEAYKQIPQYTLLNSWMTLDDFKYIFWWEWAHRFLGRFLGVAFAVPFLVFLAQGRLSRDLALPLGGLFLLGGFQGFLGWWMVSSGLTELTSVSQYRLATHLSAASLLFCAIVWVARRLERPKLVHADERGAWPVVVLGIAILVQLFWGGLVAGLDAGMGYNTWPLMDGAIIPNGLWVMDPAWRNVFENNLTVQFIHRMLAYGILAYIALLLFLRSRTGGFSGVHGWLPRIGVITILQAALGIGTLLMSVPIWMALGHQVLAFMLLGLVTLYVADLTRR